jgi:putative SOS response-associated peptidase YedK
MSVMLERANVERWLAPAELNAEMLGWMLRPYPASALGNSPKNDDARCLEPAA